MCLGKSGNIFKPNADQRIKLYSFQSREISLKRDTFRLFLLKKEKGKWQNSGTALEFLILSQVEIIYCMVNIPLYRKSLYFHCRVSIYAYRGYILTSVNSEAKPIIPVR